MNDDFKIKINNILNKDILNKEKVEEIKETFLGYLKNIEKEEKEIGKNSDEDEQKKDINVKMMDKKINANDLD